MSRSHLAQVDLSPISRLGYDNTKKAWKLFDDGGLLVKEYRSSDNPLWVVSKAYQLEGKELPEAFKHYWCRWCNYVADVRSNITRHEDRKHTKTTVICQACLISSGDKRSHEDEKSCPVRPPRNALLLPGREWLQEELAFHYDYRNIYFLFCPGALQGSKETSDRLEELRRLGLEELARRASASLSKGSATLSARQKVVYGRSTILA